MPADQQQKCNDSHLIASVGAPGGSISFCGNVEGVEGGAYVLIYRWVLVLYLGKLGHA